MAQQFIQRQKAFTLIELMLVVIIIGMLAAVIVPRFAGKQEKAKIAKAKTEIAGISMALDSLELDVGRFPSTDEGLEALVIKPASLGPEAEWDGPYLRELMPDPWGKEYQFSCPGEVTLDYDVWSCGPDGQDGGTDDIYNTRQKRTQSK